MAHDSCTKCTIPGKTIGSTVYWYDTRQHDPKTHDFYLKRSKVCCLADLPGFDLGQDVPIDYMHQVLIGCMKKFLVSVLIGVAGRRGRHKLNSAGLDEYNRRIVRLEKYTSINDFARCPRPIPMLPRMKATEIRFNLIYSSIILFDKLFPVDPITGVSDCYETLLHFHIAMRILASPALVKLKGKLEEAHAFMMIFVNNCKELFGNTYMVPNMHLMTHIVTDCKRFGDVNSFSSFPFENFLHILKNQVKGYSKPLPQACRRLAEHRNDPRNNVPVVSKTLTYTLRNNGKTLVFPDFVIIARKKGGNCADCACMLKTQEVILVDEIKQTENGVNIIGKKVDLSIAYKLRRADKPKVPFPSTEVGEFRGVEHAQSITRSADEIKNKMFYYQPPDPNEKCWIMALLHLI